MERIETINQSLRDLYGIDSITGMTIFRVVWAPDQTEKRETKYTDGGIELLHTEVRELPKYQWIGDAYVLERLVLVPDVSVKELAGERLSYEPIWSFVGFNGFPVPPTLQGCKFVIDALYAALGKKSMNKYSPTEPKISSKEEHYEANKKEIDEIQNQLYGDESGLNQQTIGAGGSGIIVPSNYKEH